MIVPSFSEGQRLAIERCAETGDPWCLLGPDTSGDIRVMREADVLAGGPSLIDAILWGTGVTADAAMDPSLLA